MTQVMFRQSRTEEVWPEGHLAGIVTDQASKSGSRQSPPAPGIALWPVGPYVIAGNPRKCVSSTMYGGDECLWSVKFWARRALFAKLVDVEDAVQVVGLVLEDDGSETLDALCSVAPGGRQGVLNVDVAPSEHGSAPAGYR